jgi:hypothetical protein
LGRGKLGFGRTRPTNSPAANNSLALCVPKTLSPGILRTEEELLDEMMPELGFQRRGKNVVARLIAAIQHTRT